MKSNPIVMTDKQLVKNYYIKYYGEIPENHHIFLLDGNYNNLKKNNLLAIPTALYGRFKNKRTRFVFKKHISLKREYLYDIIDKYYIIHGYPKINNISLFY